MCLLPSMLGMLVYFIFPYFRVWYYSVIDDQFHKSFVGIENYIDTLKNPYFQLAMKNSMLLIFIGVPVLMMLAITISLVFSFQMKKRTKLKDAFILPMLVPTAGIVLIWRRIFQTVTSALPVYLLFIWKNIGICIILLTAAIMIMDPEIFEAAKLDGARILLLHTKITLPMMMPSIFFVVLLSIVNSFRIFKESYLYYGNKYPPDHSYTLQFYMNNNFLKFNYQALATSSILTSVIVLIIILGGLSLQRRFQS